MAELVQMGLCQMDWLIFLKESIENHVGPMVLCFGVLCFFVSWLSVAAGTET